MKKVVKIEQVAHLWANQEQSEARNANNNFYFFNEVIYSYGRHFPICAIKSINGENYYFLTKRGYSVTTAKHIHIVRWAIPDSRKIIYCFDVPVYGFNSDSNIKHLSAEIMETKKRAKKARTNKPYLENEALAQIYNLKRFCELTGSTLPDMFTDNSTFDFEAYLSDEIEKERIELAHKKAQDKELSERQIQDFRSGNVYSVYGLPFDLLRLSTDKTKVQTSRGVSVDIRPVKLLWCMLKSGKDVIGRHVDNYTIQQVTDKIIKVGCHTFEHKEVLNLINQME